MQYTTDRMEEDSRGSGAAEKKVSCTEVCFRVTYVIITLVLLGCLCALVAFYFLSLIYSVDVKSSPRPNDCSVQVSPSDKKLLRDLLIDKNRAVLFVELNTTVGVKEKKETDVYQPKQWIWSHGDASIFKWPPSYKLWSFGILDHNTERDVKITIELSPPGCLFEWGDLSSTVNIGLGLLRFSKTLFPELSKVKDGRWCHLVKLHDFTSLLYENFVSVFVQDLGYRCCQFERDSQSDYKSYCSDELEINRIWTTVTFIIAILSLLVSPVFSVFIYQFLSFKSHVYWNHDKQNAHPEYASSIDEWVYSDYKSHITMFSCFRISSKTSTPDRCTTVLKRFCKYFLLPLFLVVISLSIILSTLLLFGIDVTSFRFLKQEMDSHVPLGFLSLLFPFKMDNFLSLFNGLITLVVIGLYSVCAFVYIILFGCLTTDKIDEIDDKGKYSLNLDLVEKHGRVPLNGFFETVHANFRATFTCQFWRALRSRLSDKTEKYKLSAVIFGFLYSLFVHFIPLLFANVLALTRLLRGVQISPESKCKKCQSVIFFSVLLIHCWLVFCLVNIFVGSVEYLCFMLSFCAMSIIIFPATASGIFLSVLVAIYYIVDKVRSVAKKYATLRDLCITVSKDLGDRCKGVEARLIEDKLIIAGCNVRNFKSIVVVPKAPKSKEELIRPYHCHLEEEELKIIGEIKTSKIKVVSISGVSFDVERIQSVEPFDVQIVVEEKKEKKEAVGEKNEAFEEKKEIVEEKKESKEAVEVEILLKKEAREGKEPLFVEKPITQDNPVISDVDDTCYVTYRNSQPGIPRELLDSVVDEYLPVSLARVKAFLWFVCVILLFLGILFTIISFEQVNNVTTIMNGLVVIVLARGANIMSLLTVDVNETQKTEIRKNQLRHTVEQYWMREKYTGREVTLEATPNEQSTVNC